MVHKRHSRKRGGSGGEKPVDLTMDTKALSRVHGANASAVTVPMGTSLGIGSGMNGTQGEPTRLLTGGRRRSHRRSHKRSSHKRSHRNRKHRGGSMLETALVPFNLFALQKYFQKSRTNPVSRMMRTAKKTVKRVL